MKERKNKYNKEYTTKDVGLTPPQAIDLEEALLGAILLESHILFDISTILVSKEVFYTEKHQAIYEAILSLFSQSKQIDIFTVVQELKKNENLELVGGAYYITQLTGKVSSSVNSETHARIILEKYMRREVIKSSKEYCSKAYDESIDVFDLISNLDNSIAKIQDSAVNTSNINAIDVSVSKIEKDMHERIKAFRSGKNSISGISTGINSLDEVLSGLNDSDLTILAGRPGMGKTAFMLHLSKSCSIYGKECLIFSLEMAATQLTTRLIIGEAGLISDNFRKGDLCEQEIEKFNDAKKRVEKYKITIDDKGGISPEYIKSVATTLHKKGKCDMIIIDYLQLIRVSGEQTRNKSTNDTVGIISGALKTLAKNLNIPIIALSQLSREVDKRPNKRPNLTDLRDSGNLEQDADNVIFLLRPSYYNMVAFEDGSSCECVLEIIVAKQRNGRNEDVRVNHNSSLTKFWNLEYSQKLNGFNNNIQQKFSLPEKINTDFF